LENIPVATHTHTHTQREREREREKWYRNGRDEGFFDGCADRQK